MTTTEPILVTITQGPLDGPAPCSGGDVECGAWVVFEGLVRETEDGKRIRALNYTTYEPMAQNMLAEIASAVLDKYHLLRVLVEHSRGQVPVGRCSFRLCIGAPHRKEALAAMDEFIDRMKQDVPIWKSPEWA
ncbi:MAG: hypothetical protein Kow0022_08560 [Phycisphaerales bacterium]